MTCAFPKFAVLKVLHHSHRPKSAIVEKKHGHDFFGGWGVGGEGGRGRVRIVRVCMNNGSFFPILFTFSLFLFFYVKIFLLSIFKIFPLYISIICFPFHSFSLSSYYVFSIGFLSFITLFSPLLTTSVSISKYLFVSTLSNIHFYHLPLFERKISLRSFTPPPHFRNPFISGFVAQLHAINERFQQILITIT